MDKNNWLTLAGIGVAILSAVFLTISEYIPIWVSITSACSGLLMLVVGLAGICLPKNKTPPSLEGNTKVKEQERERERERESVFEVPREEIEAKEPLVLEEGQIEEIVSLLNFAILESEKGIPHSEADVSLLLEYESRIHFLAAKYSGDVSALLSDFGDELASKKRSFSAQTIRKKRDGDYIKFRPNFLSDLRDIRKSIIASISQSAI